jgi:HEAT repeat protein
MTAKLDNLAVPHDELQTASHVAELIQQLSARNVATREHARQTLVGIGPLAVADLTRATRTADMVGRLEACKALAEIAHEAAIPALIRCLEDSHQDVRWVAAEGLLNIGSEAVEPLLLALIDRAASFTILESANHLLHGFARRSTEPIFDPLIATLKSSEPGAAVPPAAEDVLVKWRALSADVAGGHRPPILRKLQHRTGKTTLPAGF